MSNILTPFSKKIIATKSHRRSQYVFSNKLYHFLSIRGIYTTARSPGKHRFRMGEIFEVGDYCVIEQYSMFLKGNFFYTMGAFSSSNSQLPVNTIVGRYSSIAHNVQRLYGNHPIDRFTSSMLTYDKNVCAFNDYLAQLDKSFKYVPHNLNNGSPVIIGNDVWVGQDVKFVSTGITVGDGAIIAAGSLVTKDVPPYAIVGGVPAKLIKYRFSDHIIEKLMNIRWWQYGYGDFQGVNVDDSIEVFIDKIQELIELGKIHPLSPMVTTSKDFKDEMLD